MRPHYEHPSDPLDPQAPLSLTEKAVFGVDAQTTGRVYEQGSGAHPHDIQTRLFIAEAKQAEAKAALEQEALRQAEAAAAAAEKPALRLVGKA